MPPFGKGGKEGIFGKRAIHAGETDFDVALLIIHILPEGFTPRPLSTEQ